MRRWSPWSIAAGLLTVGLALRVGFSTLDSTDTDLWWHMADGRLFASLRSLPERDPFSFTSDVPWIPYAWLFDVLAYGVERVAGLPGLLLLRPLVTVLNACLMYVLVRRRLGEAPGASLVAWAFAAVTLMICAPFILMRPHLVAYTWMLLFLIVLWEYLDGRLRAAWFLVAVAALDVLWVNSHASFSLLPGILFGYTGAGLLARLLRWTLPEDRRWQVTGAALVLSVVIAFLNPAGARLALHPLDFLHPNLFTATLVEHQRTHPFGDNVPWLQILWVVEAITVPLLLRSRRVFELGILAFLTRQALYALRHTALLAIFLLPVTAVELRPFLERLTVPRSAWLRWAGSAACVGAAVWLGLAVPRMLPPERGVRWASFPSDAITFIRANDLPGPIFEPFEWGGYFVWELPERKVFIDGRSATVYSEEVYRHYLQIVNGDPNWNRLLKAYGVNLVVLNRMFETLALNKAIAETPDWILVYQDNASQLYLRNTPQNQVVVSRLRTAATLPDSATFDFTMGRQLLADGKVPQALSLLERAVQRAPFLAPAYVDLGVALVRSNRPEEARAAWEHALDLDPRIPGAHFSLGIYWQSHGDPARARREFQAEIDAAPTTPIARQAAERLR